MSNERNVFFRSSRQPKTGSELDAAPNEELDTERDRPLLIEP